VDQTSGTTPGAPPQASDSGQPGGPEAAATSAGTTGFGARGRVRRRARFLRKARELAYRDLGGLVFNLHRFGQRNDALVLSKLNTLGHIDAELRTLETALGERDTVTVLREAGITACPRCAAIHSGDDRFCPNCGLSMGRHVELPIAGPPSASSPSAPAGDAAPPPSTAAAPREVAASAGVATASWPAVSADPPVTASEGRAPGAASSAATSAAAPSPGAATGSPPEPTPAPAAERGGDRAPAEKAGRSPRPPSGRAPAASAGQATAESSEEGEQTEVIDPLAPDK
jgi:hypothetical protein